MKLSETFDVKMFFPPAEFGKVRSCSPLTAGLSGAKVLSVSTDRGEFVLKFGLGEEHWKRCLDAQSIAASHGIAPDVIAIFDAQRAFISVKIQGIPFAEAISEAAKRPRVFASLVAQLQKLHTIANHDLPTSDLIFLSRSSWQKQSTRGGFPSWALPIKEQLEVACSQIGQMPLAFSHGDLNPGNMIWDGTKLWFCDWEQASLAHPYTDLASLSIFLSLPDAAAFTLLSTLERRQIQSDASFTAIRNLARIVYACVFLERVEDLENVAVPEKGKVRPLADYFTSLRSGNFSLQDDEGKVLVGAALLKQLL